MSTDQNFKGKFGPLLIAEIGGNHEGNFEYAKHLTKEAIDSNVDYIKFQIYTGDSLVSSLESPQRNSHFKKFELTKEQHIYLADMVNEAGIGYMSSVWDVSAMGWIDSYIPIYKIGSGDLTAYPVLEKTAKIGKPIILSTGLSHESEVIESVEFIQSIDEIYKSPDHLAVLQCTSMYPIEYGDANLNVMQKLKELTGLTVGYSDHTEGSKALECAIAMGSQVLEFHFTDNREGKTFRDHKVSLTPDEIISLIDYCKDFNLLQGSSKKQPVEIEIANGHVESFRRAVYPGRDIPKGTILSENDLTVLRPNHGIDARDFYKLLGKKATLDLKSFEKLSWDMFE